MKNLILCLCLSLLAGCAAPPRPIDSQLDSLAGHQAEQQSVPQTPPQAGHQHEYLVSHIMCATEAQAQAALDRIHAGESFETVAKQVSQDPSSGAQGGHLGWSQADSFVPAFRDEILRLQVGQMSAHPIRTPFGWHIVRVEAMR